MAQGIIKINLDGAFPSGHHEGAIASIARDSSGSLLGGFVRTVRARSAFETETQALLYTLRELLQKEQMEDYLIIESDNLILVEAINGCREPPWDCRALLTECVALKTLFSNLSVLHYRRETNALADWAAKAHGRGNLPHNWASSPPQLMLDLLCIDALFKGCTFAHI
ncbi:uncharacterized protein LOC120293683 [Eucalyptus grandis]|uniref:uncharacterized protein LOC120293683 n=1 Tax=Eucalyptus grandis TaxID=71139 RepID=UPI00192EEE87|nr:uncharacterized protein LOC120293683 [Eucalyptus grandis]